jgi:hypothetical protein
MGNLVGVAQYTLRGGQNLNFAIPADALTHFEDTQNELLWEASQLADQKDPNTVRKCEQAVEAASDHVQYEVIRALFRLLLSSDQ